MTAARSMDGTRAANGPRTHVLDTNVLLYAPKALVGFVDHRQVIPITVIGEIDNPYVDATSNGLAHVIERFKNSLIAGRDFVVSPTP